MLPGIIRLNIDSVNSTNGQKDTDIECNLSDEIISKANDYNISVEKCEVPITTMPLDIGENFKIMIEWPVGAPHPALTPGENHFTISGTYYSIQEVIDNINKIIHNDLMPEVTFGQFDYDYEKERIGFRYGSVRDASDLTDAWLWLDSRLVYLFDTIPKLFQRNAVNGMHRVLLKTFVEGTNPGDVVTKYQVERLLNRFYNFKSVRIFSTLPTVAYYIFDQETNHLIRSNMLTEVVLNSETYQEGQTNLIYIPTFNKMAELTSQEPIQNFKVWFYIHYKNGKDFPLKYDRGEYLSLTLAFQNKAEL